MSFALPKIYPITDITISGLSHLEQVKRFADGGAAFIQLRDKYSSPREFYASAQAVMEFAKPRGIKVIVNDRVEIALAVGADGVHLGQDDLPVATARMLLGEKAIIGFSTHSLPQAVAASSLPLDYIAIGPVFSTQTKKDPDPIVGLEIVREIRTVIDERPLVAIGGIDRSNYTSVIEAGATSVAIIGDLLKDPETITASFRLLASGPHCNKHC